MRRMMLACLLAVVLALPAAAAEKLQPWQEKALKLVKQEKKVLDAFWRMPSRNVLYVAMQPDGGRKDGFAEYLCMLLADAGAPKGQMKMVQIYDPATFRAYREKTGSGRSMGMAACR